MQIEVVVIDDKINAAREYARLIVVSTGLQAIAVSSAQEAIEVLGQHPIRVAVLDQKMPDRPGTAVYKDLKEIDKRLKVMMLSGEADTQELDEAFKLGYDDYLHKSRIKELGDRVHTLYVRSEIDRIQERAVPNAIALGKQRIGIWPLQQEIEYWFIGSIVVEENYVFEDSWRTVKQLNAGETVAQSDSVEIERQFKYERVDEDKVTSSVSTELKALGKLSGKLEAALGSKITESQSISKKRRVEVKREYKLPEAPANPSKLHVASRHYQIAPVYRKLRVLLQRRCSCCGVDQTLSVLAYQPGLKIGTRHKDYLSDGIEKVLLTGFEILE